MPWAYRNLSPQCINLNNNKNELEIFRASITFQDFLPKAFTFSWLHPVINWTCVVWESSHVVVAVNTFCRSRMQYLLNILMTIPVFLEEFWSWWIGFNFLVRWDSVKVKTDDERQSTSRKSWLKYFCDGFFIFHGNFVKTLLLTSWTIFFV